MKKRLAFVGLLNTSGIQCISGTGIGGGISSSFVAPQITIDAHADLVNHLQESARMASRINKDVLGKKKARLLRKAEFHAAKAHELLMKVYAV
ncbi:hypothetical protein A3F06_00540 [candidate division TM6 bacterium RIFCSPHIGHO2_12_FULL_36_22]|nr:MAG: hypothetical protein A3F06_00540 [candidate division TM6 bacterium RIFCSPHIGHO2_12_FULL_36_22]